MTAGVLIVSFDALFVRLAAVDGWSVGFWRGVFMALAMLPFGWRQSAGRENQSNHKVELVTGAILALASLSLILAFTMTPAANAVVILSSAPLFAAIISQIFLKEKCPIRTWLAIFICIGGIIWVMSGSLGSGNYIGDIIALFGALLVGVYLSLLRRYPNISRERVLISGGLIMAFICLPLATPLHLPWPTYFWLTISGLIQMPLANLLLAIGPRYLPAAEVSLFLLLETIMAPIWVWLILGEIPPAKTFAGGGLILLTLISHSLAGYFQNNSD